jgi:hypothetical protein
LRENNYNTGLGGVLFDAEHYARMGPAVWLYGWLILRQTHQTGAIGWVLGGAPIHYREIEEETGFNRRTLERWMKVLRRQKYIETAVTDSGITVKILKAKKHLPRSPESRGVRKVAGSVREVAGSDPQKCVAVTNEKQSRQRFSGGIGSSSLVSELRGCGKRGKLHRRIRGSANPLGRRTRQPFKSIQERNSKRFLARTKTKLARPLASAARKRKGSHPTKLFLGPARTHALDAC